MKQRKPNGREPNPLRVSDGFLRFVLGQLEGIGAIVARSMFGGFGLYCDGVFFGIVAGDVLYLKVDDRNRGDYEAARMPPFKPYPHRPATMRYHAVPVGVLESAAELEGWARKAVAAAAGARRAREDASRRT
jgi:DNA transformation protein